MADHKKVLDAIAVMKDPAQLRTLRENADRLGVAEVEEASFRRLIEILPQETPGSIEHDFWKTIYAFEEVLRDERGKTVRLSRTRQKIQRVGVKQTLIDLAISKKPSDGFNMLIERGLPELTAEVLVLKHRDLFDTDILVAAEKRLEEAGVELSHLSPTR